MSKEIEDVDKVLRMISDKNKCDWEYAELVFLKSLLTNYLILLYQLEQAP